MYPSLPSDSAARMLILATRHPRSPSPSGSPESENLRPQAKRPRSQNQRLEEIIQEHFRATTERLAAAHTREDQRQAELLSGFNQLAVGITALSSALHDQTAHDMEMRRIEADRRAQDSERMADLYRILVSSILTHPPAPPTKFPEHPSS
jgi:transposase